MWYFEIFCLIFRSFTDQQPAQHDTVNKDLLAVTILKEQSRDVTSLVLFMWGGRTKILVHDMQCKQFSMCAGGFIFSSFNCRYSLVATSLALKKEVKNVHMSLLNFFLENRFLLRSDFRARILNVYGAPESIPRNEFRQPMWPGGPVR